MRFWSAFAGLLCISLSFIMLANGVRFDPIPLGAGAVWIIPSLVAVKIKSILLLSGLFFTVLAGLLPEH